jgi:hypothetical protein
MAFIGRLGTQDVVVPAGQYLAVASLGGGTTKLYYGSTATNLPLSYPSTPTQTLSGGVATYGAFSAQTTVRIEAASGSDVEYQIGSAPQLTTPNVGAMPTIAMGAGQHIQASTTDAITAHAGGGQGSAVLLTSDINRITTVGSANDSVKLPVSVVGMEITVTNAAAANSMNVFPNDGGTGSETINALSANAAFAVAAGKTAVFYCAKAGQWHTVLSA